MTQIEQIKAEVERLINLFPKSHGEVLPIDQNAYNLLGDLKLFIESLPAEQPSEDLEDEIDRYFKDDKWFSTPLGDIACHFANWQKERVVEKACNWLNKNVVEYHTRKGELRPIVNINAFRDAMER